MMYHSAIQSSCNTDTHNLPKWAVKVYDLMSTYPCTCNCMGEEGPEPLYTVMLPLSMVICSVVDGNEDVWLLG